ncbi:MAG: hypothetical protein K6A61_07155 [Butyrivibrio sp.]|nr:hypothetical protein [Butyrivibrio sp.]
MASVMINAGGAYSTLNGMRVPQINGVESDQIHHMPAKSSYFGKINANDGPSIFMTAKDHRKTHSFGWRGRTYRPQQKEWIFPNGSQQPSRSGFIKAQNKDIEDIHDLKAKNEIDNDYSQGITQMQSYNNTLFSKYPFTV